MYIKTSTSLLAALLLSTGGSYAADSLGRNELRIMLKPTFNPNAGDITGPQNTRCRNTAAVGAEVNYTRVLWRHFLLTGGLEGGYRRYSFVTTLPGSNESPYESDATIFHVRANAGIGYRVKISNSFSAEVRYFESLQLPMSYKEMNSSSVTDGTSISYYQSGNMGRKGSDLYFELLDGVGLYTTYTPAKKSFARSFTAGIVYQAGSFLVTSGMNHVNFNYSAPDIRIPRDQFTGSQRSMSLMLGFCL